MVFNVMNTFVRVSKAVFAEFLFKNKGKKKTVHCEGDNTKIEHYSNDKLVAYSKVYRDKKRFYIQNDKTN